MKDMQKQAQKAIYAMICDVPHTSEEMVKVVSMLKDLDSPIPFGPYRDSWPLVIYAAEAGKQEIVEALLEAGADPNVLGREFPADKTYFTALGEAAAYGHVDIVKSLLKGGADPIKVDIEYVKETHENMVRDGADMPFNEEILGLLQSAAGAKLRVCYWVQDTNRNEDGHLQLLLIKEGEGQYSVTDIAWPDVDIDQGEKMVFKLNEKTFGHSWEDTMGIVNSSMVQSLRSGEDEGSVKPS